MNRIENQLNKVKTNLKSSSKVIDITPKTTREIIESVLEVEQLDLECSSVAVIGSKSGMLLFGIGLLSPQYLVAINAESMEETIEYNLSSLQIACDLIESNISPLISNCIDMAIVGPQLDKSKITNLSDINLAVKLAKKVYCCFRTEHINVLLDKYPKASIINKILINVPLSANYQKDALNIKEFIIFKISN